MTQASSQNRDTQNGIDQCLKCYEVCTRTLAAGLEINEDQDFITALQLCAQTCQLVDQALLLDSPFAGKTSLLCAEICEEVALICEEFEEEEMRDCGAVCAECAKVCRQIHEGEKKKSQQLDHLLN